MLTGCAVALVMVVRSGMKSGGLGTRAPGPQVGIFTVLDFVHGECEIGRFRSQTICVPRIPVIAHSRVRGTSLQQGGGQKAM